MNAIIFPGQGSQSIGMGREVYHAFRCAKDVFQEVDEALSQNLSKIIFEGPESDLTLTENTQPALMVVSMALMRVLEKEGKMNVTELASYAAGHSLGQYTALCATGSLSLTDTARLLKIRGQAMQKAVPLDVGAMAAILGLDMSDIEQIVKEAAQSQVCDIANDNSPGQVVISGHKEAIERAMKLAQEKGAKRSILLNVSAPFHCTLMKPAQERMVEAFKDVTVKDPCIPILDNVSAEAIDQSPQLTLKLIEQVTGRVRWREGIETMEKLGVHTTLEIGAGKILTGLSKRIAPSLNAIALNTPHDIESFLKKDIAA